MTAWLKRSARLPGPSCYGLTTYGSSSSELGNVFEITPSGSFTLFAIGMAASSTLIIGTDGAFYGTTGRSVFKLTTSGVSTILHNFCSMIDANGNYLDGCQLDGDLLQAKDGNFYGVTLVGGLNPNRGPSGQLSPGHGGTVFRVTPSGYASTVYSFCKTPDPNSYNGNCLDRFSPDGGLVQGPNGTFYGTTTDGGLIAGGTVFALSVAPIATSKFVTAGAQTDYLGEGKSGFTV